MGRPWDGAGTTLRTVRPVLASYVLRLAVDRLADGAIAGEVQVVESGARIAVRDEGELIEAILRHRPAVTPQPAERRTP